ncbi:hypothetical protein [Algiphilus sp.]|uniref:tetratricopeptide repeat protein n=1 Tax=Algiphilus sp. TaxID=1872431 RepID=UPI0025BC7B5E|nr:hypothetical protein [Algiphilus sp.]MCK5771165.1 tetratricopeptide repeat protein [Algiphilus sp.]
MQFSKVQKDFNDVEARSEATEVVFADVIGIAHRLKLPPPEELAEIAEIRSEMVSLEDKRSQFTNELTDAIVAELERRLSSFERFGTQSKYLRSVADLAALAGRSDDEALHLRAALSYKESVSTKRQLAENRLQANALDEALHLFSSPELAEDVPSRLRLGYMAVVSMDLQRAMAEVTEALKIDSTDYAARLFEGALHLATGHPQFAIRSFRVAMQMRPSSSVLYCNLGIAYLQLRQRGKALDMLRRAIQLNPINSGAIRLFADLARNMNRDDLAIGPLEHCLRLHADRADLWSRLARAKYFLRDYIGALNALKHESALSDNSALWNNMGAVYEKLGQRSQAIKRVAHALALAETETPVDALRAARNMARLLASQGEHKEVLALTASIVHIDPDQLLVRDKDLSDLTAFRLRALINLEEFDVVNREMQALLEREDTAPQLRRWMAIAGIAFSINRSSQRDLLVYLTGKGWELVEDSSSVNTAELVPLVNNIACACAELGEVDEAETRLQRVSWAIGRDPFVTATKGLIRIRKGDIDRGTALYRKAIRLAHSRADATKIRQKMNLELGMVYLEKNPKTAQKYLKQVVHPARNADSLLADLARRLLRSLES